MKQRHIDKCKEELINGKIHFTDSDGFVHILPNHRRLDRVVIAGITEFLVLAFLDVMKIALIGFLITSALSYFVVGTVLNIIAVFVFGTLIYGTIFRNPAYANCFNADLQSNNLHREEYYNLCVLEQQKEIASYGRQQNSQSQLYNRKQKFRKNRTARIS